ncbi:MAG: aminotransferase class V-fold PLP-dependent enzyme [Clostridiaceae bacterium]|nr:aminotransferase class V-fold PLP-dependent enzyme [Clostridiaceae bacterium]
MPTPLYTALQTLAAQHTARFHMPGHKGQPHFPGFDDIFSIDFTEIYGTGNLYEAEGPIREAEVLAAQYFHAADCHFLTGGSSQGVIAMLGAVCGDGGHVLLDRTCHKSAMHAAALFDLTPHFLFPVFLPYAGCGGMLDLSAVEASLQEHPEAAALMVVSPNYYGVMQPIRELAALCHRYGKKLIVDAAHGAHLDAVGCPNPVALGADAAVVSAHKTLPALGQGAYLLCGADIDADTLRRHEAMCGTSSPSYPIMASLDLAREYLETHADEYATAVRRVARLRRKYDGTAGLRALTGADAPLDPLRLTISCANGLELSDTLYARFGVACEMADHHNIVCIVTPADLTENLSRLEAALDACAPGTLLTPSVFAAPPASVRGCSVRHALLSPGSPFPFSEAVGSVCARPVTPYPPGIPLLWPGEEILAKHIEFLTERCYNTVSEVIVCAKPSHRRKPL